MAAGDLDRLIQLLARLPGLGPRSARRAALHLLKKRESLMQPLGDAIAAAALSVKNCSICGNLDSTDPCDICREPKRDPSVICVVTDVGDLWALERSVAFRGRYHVLGALLSALDGRGPEALRVGELVARASDDEVREVILALPATVDGQTTAHYLAERLGPSGAQITMLARGVPVGGELDWLDDGTIAQAMRARRPA